MAAARVAGTVGTDCVSGARCGAQTFLQRMHNAYSYVANAAADYIIVRPYMRREWCARLPLRGPTHGRGGQQHSRADM